MDIDKIKLGTGISGNIYLFRHGVDANVALDKREAEGDVMGVFVQHMMHDADQGSKKVVAFGSLKFEVSCIPVKEATQ